MRFEKNNANKMISIPYPCGLVSGNPLPLTVALNLFSGYFPQENEEIKASEIVKVNVLRVNNFILLLDHVFQCLVPTSPISDSPQAGDKSFKHFHQIFFH